MLNKLIIAVLSAAVCAGASAGTIIGATGAVINSGGPGYGNIADTYNQNGLSTGYTSGVTDFATYMAGAPLHTTTFGGFEWFGNLSTTSATVTYDLGSTRRIDAFALWNEESSGIGAFNLYTSTDGLGFSLLAGGLAPLNNPSGSNYGAEVFSFAATNTRYVRLEMSGCPQPSNGAVTFDACAIGEVAFDATAAAADVPEPASLALLGLGIAGLVGARRKRA